MTFVPAASTYDAEGNAEKLRDLYRLGTRTILIVSLPILATLMTRGRTFIRLWMGAQYAGPSGTVLLILATALAFNLANHTAGAVSMGTDRHKFTARCMLAEGASNLTLSIVLAHFFGINGVAVGTLIPNLVIQLGVWPGYIGRAVGMSRWQIVVRVWGAVFLAVVPFAVVSFFVDRHVYVHSIVGFFGQTLALLTIFAATLLLVFRDGFRTVVMPMVRARLRRGEAVAA